MSFQNRVSRLASTQLSIRAEFDAFLSRWNTIENGLSDLSENSTRRRVVRALREMDVIAKRLERRIPESSDPETEVVGPQFEQVNAIFQQRKNQIKSMVDEADAQYQYRTVGTAREQMEQQLLEDDDAYEIELLQHQTRDLLQGMRQLTEITQQVGTLIKEQHETVVRVDDTIQDAVGEMKAGNEELAVAEGYQKGSGRMTCVILIVVIVIALIAGGVCLYFFVFKKKE
jgi:methyl-accepting chemotaxis protein